MRVYFRSRLLALGVLATLVVVSALGISPAASAHPMPRFGSSLHQHLKQAMENIEPVAPGPRHARARNLSLVGSLALPGFNADVWGYKGFAYVGTWGAGDAKCPATGIRIVDLANPQQPRLIGAVAEIPKTTQEDVEVLSVSTSSFHGDLLVAGIQTCGWEGPQGLDLWDVSDPYHPQHLGFWDSRGAFGVHELTVFQQGGRVYVAAATPFSDFAIGEGDFRLVDVTDPRNPVEVSEWGLSDIGAGPVCEDFFVYCTFAHSVAVSKDGNTAILSYWDFGAIFLDISNPAKPTYVRRTMYPENADGDTHSVALARGDNLLLTADEDWSPVEHGDSTWGFLRIWDIKGTQQPRQISTFATTNARTGAQDGFYSIHNPYVRGNTAYISWYSDGLRVVDISQPQAPREIASFVPPAASDPYGIWPDVPMVWGVHVDRSLILLSDINGGLYVLKHTP